MSNINQGHVWVIEKRIFNGFVKDEECGRWVPTKHLFTVKIEAQEKMIELFQQGTQDKLRLVKYTPE